MSSVDIEASCLAICERELQNTYQNVQLLCIVLRIPLPLWCLPISASPAPRRGTIYCKIFDKSVDLFVPQLSIWEWGESYTACSQDPWQLYPVMIQRLHQPLIFPGVVFNALLNIVESHWNGNLKMRLENNDVSWNKIGLRKVDEECNMVWDGKKAQSESRDGMSSTHRQD